MVGGRLRLPIEAPDVEEATPLGAAMLAAIGVGLYRDEEDAFEHVRKPSMVYEANPEAAKTYARLFPIYQQIYLALEIGEP